MEYVKWPEGRKSAVMFSFDLDGDVIWRNMSADEPNAKKLCIITRIFRRMTSVKS